VSHPRHLDGKLVTSRRGFFWAGGEPFPVRDGTALRGQMFVQWEAPAEVTKQYPVVLIHGGGGQGTDWLGTPDSRPGWATFLLEEGYAVYVVDRPGHGRSPYHPDVLGPPGGVFTLEMVTTLFTDAANGPAAHPKAHLHTQWPGTGDVDDPSVRGFAAGTGPMVGDCRLAHALEQACGAALLDEIGPAILITASAGGPMGWLTADARPESVKAIVAVEPVGPAFMDNPAMGLSLEWGLTAAPMTFDPPAASPEELRADTVRKLPALARVPIALVETEASLLAQPGPATAAFLEEAGCSIERIVLAEHGVHGNGHLVMMERNNREALGPTLRWLDDTVS
jgi:pimeloyl-ACP methyl ester carboxylesterase